MTSGKIFRQREILPVNTYEEALADVKYAIQFHIETFGRGALLKRTL